MAIVTPPRSLDQRHAALALANAVRSKRKEMKLYLRTGHEDIGTLIMSPPSWLESMKVQDLLLAVPRLGPVKVGTILKRRMISPSKTVGGLGARQRYELLRELRLWARRYER